jgi:MFS superfamily sulfate permease-like transporter/CRP-like cAMP-binding protein
VPPAWRTDPRGNVVGGLLAAIVTLPLSMGFGALAFSAFGPEYATRGVLAGLFAAAFLGLITILMGARGVAIYAPRSLVSFMIASVSADLFLQAKWLPADDPDLLTAAIFLLLALSGAFQLAFGLARLAKVVKFIPTPVMAGFQNAAAIVIMFSQLHLLLGLPARPALAQWPAALAGARPLNMLVAGVTLLAIFQAHRITKRVPPLVLGLAIGTLLYYFFALCGLEGWLGPTLGSIPVRFPDAQELATIMLLTTVPGFGEALPAIVVGAASIALVASLDVLINAKIVENLSRRRGNGTQELVSIGAANLITPLLGGIAGSISLGSTTTAYKGGARNSLGLLVHALLFLLFVPLLAPAIGHIPRVVIAALLFQAGTQLFDRWTLQLVARVAARRAIHWPSISIDLFVIVLVASIALAGEVVAAVLIGVTLAVVVFTLRMSRGVIRREQYGDVVQARRSREAADASLLAANGRSILAIELEGPIFFASAEMLHNRVDAAIAEGVRYVLLDVTRVTELDSTGARFLMQCDERLRAANCRMVLSGSDSRPELAALLGDHGVAEALTRERMFADLDRALEWCENDLLATLRGAALASGEYPFELLGIVRDIDPADREALRPALVRRTYQAGETVFRQGDDGNALHVIALGSASVWLRHAEGDERRLMTFSQGTFFGEMALLDRERRSATVTADEMLVCYVLERSSFDQLAVSHPRAGLALLASLARELSRRMRRANRTLLELV